MHLHQQRSPYLFDIDSPYLQKFRKLSGHMRDSHDSLHFQFVPKSSERLKSPLIGPSIRLQKVNVQENQENVQLNESRNKMSRTEQRRKKAITFRQHSQPLSVSRQQTNRPVQSSSNPNQNVRKRLTSLQRYFQQTRSIQLPFQTQNRIFQNEKFLTEIKDFQENLSRMKPGSALQSRPNMMTQRNNSRRTRLSETRPKPLKIHELENQNVKKEKSKIQVEKIMKNKIKQFRQKEFQERFHNGNKNVHSKTKAFSFPQKPVPLQNQVNFMRQQLQIESLTNQVENIQNKLIMMKRASKQKRKTMREIQNYFGFLY